MSETFLSFTNEYDKEWYTYLIWDNAMYLIDFKDTDIINKMNLIKNIATKCNCIIHEKSQMHYYLMIYVV